MEVLLQQLSCLQAGRFSPLQLQQAVLQARQDLQARRDILACSLRRLDRRCRPDKGQFIKNNYWNITGVNKTDLVPFIPC